MDLEFVYFLIQAMLIVVIAVGVAVLIGLSVAIRDVKIIKERPFLFAIETLLISILPAVPLLFFAVSRGIPMAKALAWFYGLAFKFAVFHILLQISGFYSYWFQQ